MNRNSIFMWAYITFILAAMLIHMAVDYPLWTPLVMAITISSMLFAFESFYASSAKTLSDACDIRERFTPMALKRTETARSFYEKFISILTGIEYDVSDLKKKCEYSKETISDIMQSFSDIEHEAETGREKQKQYQRTADIFAYVGFLSLFCTLIFAPLITIPASIQDFFSVFPFFVILLTNQINIYESEKNKSKMVKYQEVLMKIEEIEKGLSDIECNFNALIGLNGKNVYKSEEEAYHAD